MGVGPRARTRCTTSRSAARRDGTMLAVRDHIWVDLGAYNVLGHRAPLQHGRPPARPASRRATSQVECHGGRDEQDAERALPRRRPARGGVRDGPHRRLPRARARHGPGRAPAPELSRRAPTCPYELGLPVSRRQPARLRQRRLPRRRSRRRCDAVGYDGAPRRAGGAARARGSTAASASRATSRAPPSARTRARRSGSTPSGRAVVATGAASQGQGHETSFAQIAADALGIPLDWVTVIGGDTAADPVRRRHVRQPQRGERGQLHPRRTRRRVRDKLRAPRRRRCWRRRPTTSRSPTAWSRCAGAPASAMPLGARDPGLDPDLRQARRGLARLRGDGLSPPADVTYTSAVHVRASRWTSRPAR